MIGEQAILALDGNIIPAVAILAGVLVAIVAIVGGIVKAILRTRQVEQTKREVAAYIAEGTMDPEDAARILGREKSNFESKIGNAVSWGMISPGKAERLIRAFCEKERGC